MTITWQLTGAEVLIGRHSVPVSTGGKISTPLKVAAFDLDSTLIVAKSGKLKGEDPSDWTWWHETVPVKLQQTYDEGFQIVIFTNQGRLTTKDGAEAPEAQTFRSKVETIFETLNVPATIYAACANDNWRKPRTRAWEHFVESTGLGQNANIAASYLVGDAAGRPADHTADDRHFSINVGIRFYTPEEYFLGAPPEAWQHKFDPSWYLDTASAGECSLDIPKEQPSILLLVGLPGSGKTTYYFNVLQKLGYERIQPSSVGSTKESVETATKILGARKCVVIDDLNHDHATRQKWITVGKAHDAPVFAAHFLTPPKLCLHNDAVRALGGPEMNWEKRNVYPRVPFWDLTKCFEPPQEAEGFVHVFEIEFKWAGTNETLNIWRKFWI